MVESFDLQTDRALFTDPTTANVKGIRLNNDMLSVVDGSLSILKVLNNLSTGLIAALPAASQIGLWYWATDTDQLFFDDGSRWVLISGRSIDSGCLVYLAAPDQSIATSTYTKIEMQTEDFDLANEYDPVTNFRFTAQRAGKYAVSIILRLGNPTADKTFYGVIYLNGASILSVGTHMSSTGSISAAFAGVMDLAANDYLECFAWQDCGGNKSVLANLSNTQMSIMKLA